MENSQLLRKKVLYERAKQTIRKKFPSGHSDFTYSVMPLLNPNKGGIDNYANRMVLKKALPNATELGKRLKSFGATKEEISDALRNGIDLNSTLRGWAAMNMRAARAMRDFDPKAYEEAKQSFRESLPALKSGLAGASARIDMNRGIKRYADAVEALENAWFRGK